MSDDHETGFDRPMMWVATRPLPPEYEIYPSYYNCTTPEDWEVMQAAMRDFRRPESHYIVPEINYGQGNFKNVISMERYLAQKYGFELE